MPIELTPLEPVDRKRCQAEIIEYRPFVMGGRTTTRTRCEAPAEFIATEKQITHRDGRLGAMSLCAKCRAAYEARFPNGAAFTPV